MKTIGLFVGSFNPFHIGHMYLARQAKSMFDGVVVVQADNETKPSSTYNIFKLLDIEKEIKFLKTHDMTIDQIVRRTEEVNPSHNVVLVRGLRDSHDLLYESKYIAWIRELGVHNAVVHILTPPELTHVSSSSLRELEKLGKMDVVNRFIF